MSQAKDPYVYPGTTTLINTFNIRDKTKLDRVETKFSAIRLTTANQKNVPGKFDYEHLKNIHKHIFKDIYPFAGKQRTIGISKAEPVLNGKTVSYPHPNDPFPPENLSSRATYAFDELKKDNHLKGLNNNDFVNKLTKHSTEIWEAHPFREGNTRTVVAFMRQLAKQAGHEINGDLSKEPKQLRDAFVLAVNGDNKLLKEIIGSAVAEKKVLDYDHLKKENPNAYNKIELVRKAAVQYSQRVTSDPDSQKSLSDSIGNRTYARFREGNKIPEVRMAKQQPQARNDNDKDTER